MSSRLITASALPFMEDESHQHLKAVSQQQQQQQTTTTKPLFRHDGVKKLHSLWGRVCILGENIIENINHSGR